MDKVSVQSTQIRSIKYNDADKTMEVEFNTGAVYQYRDVDAEVYNQFVQAQSIGRFFHASVKGNYATKMLRAKEEVKK